MGEISTIEPVTLSGWYELTDGRIQYFYWSNGQLLAGEIVHSWEEVGKIKLQEMEQWPWDQGEPR